MAKATKLKDYTVAAIKGTPHHGLKIGKHVIVPPSKMRKKYLFSSAKKAKAYFDTQIKPSIKYVQ